MKVYWKDSNHKDQEGIIVGIYQPRDEGSPRVLIAVEGGTFVTKRVSAIHHKEPKRK